MNIGGVMVRVFSSSAVDRGIRGREVKRNTIKLSLMHDYKTQHLEIRAKTDGLGIMLMCPSGAPCLAAGAPCLAAVSSHRMFSP